MARSYNRSIINFSGGMSPALAPEVASQDEAQRILNMVWEDGKLHRRHGTRTVSLSISGSTLDAEVLDAVEIQAASIFLVVKNLDSGNLEFYESASVSGSTVDVTQVTVGGQSSDYFLAFWQAALDSGDLAGVRLIHESITTVVLPVMADGSTVQIRPLMYRDGSFGLIDRIGRPDPETVDSYSVLTSTELVEESSDLQEATMSIPAGSTSLVHYFATSLPVSTLSIERLVSSARGGITVDVDYYTGADTWGDVQYRPGYSEDTVSSFSHPEDTAVHWYQLEQPMYEDDQWEYGAGTQDQDSGLLRQTDYVLRIELTLDSPQSYVDEYTFKFYFDSLQYANQNTAPTIGVFHNQRLWLGEGNILNSSQWDDPTTWNTQDVELFIDGGERINDLLSFRGTLLVFKDKLTYGLGGTSYLSYKKEVVFNKGADHAIEFNDMVWFTKDGKIYVSSGTGFTLASGHMEESFTSEYPLVKRDRYIYCGNYFFDPLSFQEDPRTPGGGRVAFYEFSGPNHLTRGVNRIYCVSGGSLVAWSYDYADDDGETIDARLVTHYLFNGDPGVESQIERIKFVLGVAGSWEIIFRPDLGRFGTVAEEVSTSAYSGSPVAASGAQIAVVEHTLPYRLDGRTIQIELRNRCAAVDASLADVRVHGIHFSFRRRRF